MSERVGSAAISSRGADEIWSAMISQVIKDRYRSVTYFDIWDGGGDPKKVVKSQLESDMGETASYAEDLDGGMTIHTEGLERE